MESVHGMSPEQSQLRSVVRGVRNRYRAKRLLRGAAITVAGGWVIAAAAAYAMSVWHYADAAVLAGRIVTVIAVLALAAWFIVRPLWPRLRDEQVALYLEEHERSLRAAVVTAVEMHGAASVSNGPARSPALIERLTRAAVERVHKTGDGKAVDAGELRVNGGILAAVIATALVFTLFGPPILRHGVRLIAAPWRDDTPVSLFSIAVEPGNATVAKGGDELISARLRGFQSEQVELLMRAADSLEWTRVPMLPDSSGRYAYRMFDIGNKTQYAVEANGVRSTTYTIDVSNLPYVRQMDLEYRYPAYTQLPPLDVDSTGDIAALKGTMVRIRVAPTLATKGGRVVVDDGDTLQLAPMSDGRLMAMLRVDKPGFYKIELQGPDGKMVTGSLDYTIDVLPDRPPTVAFSKPGRDQKVLSVDEVYTEARAEDDYGVAKLELMYSVNGGPEKAMSLHDGTRAIRDISAGYTFMLEGLQLQPGDVVSYYARATDNDAVSGPQQASTDIYFLQVRPFENDYRQQQGGNMGGGGGQNDANQLSQRQREIIAATFKTSRDSAQTEAKPFSENLATIRLSQQRLREQTTQLATRLVERGIASSDSNWNRIAQILPRAAAAMDTAEKKLSASAPTSALGPEQRALAELQRAEAVFREIQVSMGGGGGGGGGGNRTDAQDLADIFELQKDRLRNQYETVQRGQQQSQQQQQADNQVDETAEKLRQLASRQQQENERARAKADSLARIGASGAQGGQGQRDIAQQTEDQARQLERLAREQQSQSLADAARRLQDAANAMRRAAATNGSQRSSESAQALNNLNEARRLLDQEKNGRSSRDLNDAMQQAQRLAEQEKQVQSDVEKLAQSGAGGANGNQQQLQQSIAEQKGAMADQVKQLKSKLDRMALDTKRDQRDLARALESAADTLRGRKVEEKLRYTQQAARTAPPDWMRSAEQQIGADIADLNQRLQQAQTAAQTASGKQDQSRVAERARDLVRGLESMDERMRQRAQEQAGARGQQQSAQSGNQQGQQGRQGQQAQANGGRQGQGQQQQGQQGGQQNAQGGQQGQQSQQGQQGGQQGQQAGQQGQQANGGGQAQGGQQMGNGGGNPNAGGIPRGGAPQGTGARLSPDDAQQFSREAQQRLNDAEALRRELARAGQPTKDLDRAIDDLRQLANPQVLEDTRASADLRAKTIEGFKDFEFALRRSMGEGDSTRVLLERSGDVPPAYKQHVEEYYRAIGKGKKP
jgi:hypothetical protein